MTTQERTLDVICLGRVAVDLYGEQVGARLEDMRTFAKYLGGSSGNVAHGTARQGLKSGMLARVGDEHMGRFVCEELERVGVDTSHIITDKERLTALVLLGIKDEDTFPLIFYRDNCADKAITPDDISEEYIASAKCLAITGTHLSNPSSREAVITALNYARKHGVRTALDVDFRPVLWGLTSLGDGETRFIASEEVTNQLQEVLGLFDLIVGTEEEFHIAGGSEDSIEALKVVRGFTDATLVCKRGPLGCSVFTDEIGNHLDDGITVKGVRVEVLNVLGAGDAFMSGLLRGYLNDEPWEQSCRYANACGALVVSRHGCSPAMPTKEELDYYLLHEHEIPRPDRDNNLNHLHRVTTREKEWPELCVLAFDHRSQFVEMAQQAGADIDHIPYLKKLIWRAAQEVAESAGLQGKAGILCDSTFGTDVLNAVTGFGNSVEERYWIGRPIELPSSRPLRLEHGNIGTQLANWPREQVVKCLMFYHPDDQLEMQQEQEQTLLEVYQACCATGNELLVEVILPRDGEAVSPDVADDLYLRVMTKLYNVGIKPDWWKLPPLTANGWQGVDTLIFERDTHCRGVVLLGLDAPADELKAGFSASANAKTVKGFAVGRTIFGEPSRQWLRGELDNERFVDAVKANYLALIETWRQR
ncbi:bifunctional 5-dehydro-2-deoxygluconokinase/5-dehydro-2-deoxyphosphogluconate aldolase [Enterovibrio calviensis]|uniref:bifunctional 5-dehydro-2-deoxygluconokinase/5-dehydro-2- deoxyphosphogluconate aldolase n=1 Tax=Enterovibrio calviensis TaxID=91359 RepID=UPI000487F6FC|nr:5-dehydro-2-deoxygluconokinase [Enterovibrio calviensis]